MSKKKNTSNSKRKRTSNDYRKNVKGAQLQKMKALGIKYQVHHLISKSALENSGKKDFLYENWYNINRAKNLEAYPCELEGACHLKVQLHRGNHGKDNDSDHDDTYHDKVEYLLEDVFDDIKENDFCATVDDQKKLEKILDDVSDKIKGKIERYKLELTTIAETFKEGNLGCANHTSVPSLREGTENKTNTMCSKNRIHY